MNKEDITIGSTVICTKIKADVPSRTQEYRYVGQTGTILQWSRLQHNVVMVQVKNGLEKVGVNFHIEELQLAEGIEGNADLHDWLSMSIKT